MLLYLPVKLTTFSAEQELLYNIDTSKYFSAVIDVWFWVFLLYFYRKDTFTQNIKNPALSNHPPADGKSGEVL